MDNPNKAILLVNLGTPDAPEKGAIRRYLKQFLSDPRVVDLPRWLWLPILNLIILNVRPARLVEKYELIWGRRDGPIRNITRALARRLEQQLPGSRVVTAMTYGSPSVAEGLSELAAYDAVTILPLFPQYAGATTGAVEDELNRALETTKLDTHTKVIPDYHQHPAYIEALARSVRASYLWRKQSPYLVFSFHGIPVSQSSKGDPYRRQCETTASLVAHALDLGSDQWTLSFQSRFGPAEWLGPYTDATMEALPQQGVKDVLVICPGFSVDCLETIEEINILNRGIFLDAGGESFGYVKALNATRAHAAAIASVIEDSRPG